jgi:signal peptidase I
MAVLAASAIALWRDPAASRRSAGWPAFLAVLLLFLIFTHSYFVSSRSMENTLLPGDGILAQSVTWRLGHTPQRGDVVLVRFRENPRDIFIKRVVGVPGDRLRMVNKQLYRNGQPVSEPYAIHRSGALDNYRDNFPAAPTLRLARFAEDMLENHVRDGEVCVPEGEYFVLGDNRDDSLDSRYFGFISRSGIVGSPVLIYESFHGPQGIARLRWNRILKPL